MSEVLSRQQAVANAMNAERQLVENEAKANTPDDKVSAAARLLREAGRAKHPKEAAQEAAEETPADEVETAAPAEGDDQGDPNAEGDEPVEGQAIILNGKRTTAEEIARDYIPKAEYTSKTMAHQEQVKRFNAE